MQFTRANYNILLLTLSHDELAGVVGEFAKTDNLVSLLAALPENEQCDIFASFDVDHLVAIERSKLISKIDTTDEIIKVTKDLDERFVLKKQKAVYLFCLDRLDSAKCIEVNQG